MQVFQIPRSCTNCSSIGRRAQVSSTPYSRIVEWSERCSKVRISRGGYVNVERKKQKYEAINGKIKKVEKRKVETVRYWGKGEDGWVRKGGWLKRKGKEIGEERTRKRETKWGKVVEEGKEGKGFRVDFRESGMEIGGKEGRKREANTFVDNYRCLESLQALGKYALWSDRVLCISVRIARQRYRIDSRRNKSRSSQRFFLAPRNILPEKRIDFTSVWIAINDATKNILSLK